MCGVELRCVVLCSLALCCFLVDILVVQIKRATSKYQQHLMEMSCALRTSLWRNHFGKDGDVNKLFLTHLLSTWNFDSSF